MSDQKPCTNPTNLDLHVEQTRQGIILEKLSADITDIKQVLVGDDQRRGLVVDVDRLQRSFSFTKAILWVVFTTLFGSTASAVYAAFFMK